MPHLSHTRQPRMRGTVGECSRLFLHAPLRFRILSEFCTFLVGFIFRYLIIFWRIINGSCICYLLACNISPQNRVATTRNIYSLQFLWVQHLVGWLWLKVSYEIAVKLTGLWSRLKPWLVEGTHRAVSGHGSWLPQGWSSESTQNGI